MYHNFLVFSYAQNATWNKLFYYISTIVFPTHNDCCQHWEASVFIMLRYFVLCQYDKNTISMRIRLTITIISGLMGIFRILRKKTWVFFPNDCQSTTTTFLFFSSRKLAEARKNSLSRNLIILQRRSLISKPLFKICRSLFQHPRHRLIDEV